MSLCKKCNYDVEGNYCAQCGHPQNLNRIDGRYILSEIGKVFNFEKGIFYTIRELLIRPGKNIKTFISEDRNRLVKPILFILICSVVYSLVVQLFSVEDGYIKYFNENPTAVTAIFEWVQANYGYTNIIIAIFIAIWLKILFRRYEYNIFELLILLCFIMGIAMLIFSLFSILVVITKIKLMKIASFLFVVYLTWAIGQFYDKKKVKNYIKAFFAYLLGMISFAFTATGLGLLIDLMM